MGNASECFNNNNSTIRNVVTIPGGGYYIGADVLGVGVNSAILISWDITKATLQYSDDLSNWIDIETKTINTGNHMMSFWYTNGENNHRAYRFFMVSTDGNGWVDRVIFYSSNN